MKYQLQLIQSDEDFVLSDLPEALASNKACGVDTETTGLNPREAKPRLLQIATLDHRAYVIDLFHCDVSRLRAWAEDQTKHKLVHFSRFDCGFLKLHLGWEMRGIVDTMLAAQVHHAGLNEPGFSLQALVEQHCGYKLDKEEQRSDWRGTLTLSQLQYAAADAVGALELGKILATKLAAQQQREIAHQEYDLSRLFLCSQLTGLRHIETTQQSFFDAGETTHYPEIRQLNGDCFAPTFKYRQRAFHCPPGLQFVIADYRDIDLWLLATEAQDENLTTDLLENSVFDTPKMRVLLHKFLFEDSGVRMAKDLNVESLFAIFPLRYQAALSKLGEIGRQTRLPSNRLLPVGDTMQQRAIYRERNRRDYYRSIVVEKFKHILLKLNLSPVYMDQLGVVWQTSQPGLADQVQAAFVEEFGENALRTLVLQSSPALIFQNIL